MSENKRTYRSVAIAVGVLCAVLITAMAYSVVTYTSMLQNKDAQISALNTQIANLGGQPNPNPSTSSKDAQIAGLQNQIANLQNHLSLSIGTTLETYYQYVRLNCYTVVGGLETVDEAKWQDYPNYYNTSVTFAADLAAHDIGQAYWATLENDSGYYDKVGEYSYQTSSRIMQEAMTLANISSSDSSAMKIDKVLTFINSDVHYETKLLDHMWFPCETLTFHSGDCTGFSILAASMFEEAGIKSAIGFFTNSTLGGGHAMVLVHLDNLDSHGYLYYSDLTSCKLMSGKWIIIEPQYTSLSEQDANLNRIGYWSLEACAEVPYGP